MIIGVSRKITTFGDLYEEEVTAARTVCRCYRFLVHAKNLGIRNYGVVYGIKLRQQ